MEHTSDVPCDADGVARTSETDGTWTTANARSAERAGSGWTTANARSAERAGSGWTTANARSAERAGSDGAAARILLAIRRRADRVRDGRVRLPAGLRPAPVRTPGARLGVRRTARLLRGTCRASHTRPLRPPRDGRVRPGTDV